MPRRWSRRWPALAAALLAGAGALPALDTACPFPRGLVGQRLSGGSTLVLDRQGGLVAWRVDRNEEWRLPVRLEQVSPWLVRATLAAEDKRFYEHRGVDPLAVARALGQNVCGARRVSGASTVTMQAMRLLQPRPRTWSAKAVEGFRALQIERLAGKEEIIEIYFNLAPYGGNTVGAEAAARRYFGKGAAELTLGEAALLAGLPQRPAAFDPRRHMDKALGRREFVLRRMGELGLASADELAAARRQPIELSPRRRAADAAAFADWVAARAGGDTGTLRTTLDPGVQAATGRAAAARASELAAMGIDGLAVIVVDVPGSEILAMVGSAVPDDPLVGRVNAAAAPRQPGSLFKPFIYARAYASGLATPDSLVYDLPGCWGGYRPENHDREFLGPLRAARALRESRNLPAVRLLAAMGPETLSGDLAALGVGLTDAPGRCGLSLALGSAEARPVELAGAYAALARLGEHRPLRCVVGEPPGEARQVWPAGAAYLTLRCLGEAPHDAEVRMAWKTGTSWDFRDAWAVAMSPSRVVAVWCGRLSGRGHAHLTGGEAALPLALELCAELSPEARPWPRPEPVASRRVCALSGLPAGPWCPEARQGEYLAGVSAEPGCTLHGPGPDGRTEVRWPAEVAAWMGRDASGTARPGTAPRALAIRSPRAGGVYVLGPGAGADPGTEGGVMHLSAAAAPGTGRIYWLLDGALLARSAPGRSTPWPMKPGRHRLTVADETGASASAEFEVLDGR